MVRGKNHVRFCRLACSIIGNDGLQVGALSPLLAAVAIGSGGSNTCDLFAFVQHGLGKINALHDVELEGVWATTAERRGTGMQVGWSRTRKPARGKFRSKPRSRSKLKLGEID